MITDSIADLEAPCVTALLASRGKIVIINKLDDNLFAAISFRQLFEFSQYLCRADRLSSLKRPLYCCTELLQNRREVVKNLSCKIILGSEEAD